MEVAPLIPMETTNIVDVIMDSKSQDSWGVSIKLGHISRGTITNSIRLLSKIVPKQHRKIGAQL